LENFREEIILNKKRTRGELPFDIFLKSTNDLVQSIISSLRTDVFYNYIFCEGSSDYIYLKYYLNEYIKTNRLRILPLAGWGEISKIMKTISLALNEKEDEIKGKILAIIDTDKAGNRIDNFNETNHLYFKRMIFNEEMNNIALLSINSTEGGDTSIEDVLNPNAFIETLKCYQDSPYYTILKDEPINTDALCSYNVYNYRMSDKKQLKDFFKSHNGELKVEFAKKYLSFLTTYDKIPKVFVDIIELLNLNITFTNEENHNGIPIKNNNDSEIKQSDQKKKIVIVKNK
jgi:hypothetical protein